ncbi:uncharacterized protein LOC120176579 [Hibiscus syriacus]|uniref:uncharacterized protein LOC120176579 n=1 Tax=Hibiscus syriacus TaxID=106335 RepID=UPI001920B737|nr:uncharacterized protein LOC120176579 [Hibiscus syriacus]
MADSNILISWKSLFLLQKDFLRDVINKLNNLRGYGMANRFSWSSKRLTAFRNVSKLSISKGSSETYGSSKDSNDVAQTRRKHHSWSEFKELEEDDHRIFMAKTNRELISEGNSVSTQTDGVKQGRFGVEIAEEHEMEPNDLHDSRPSSNSNSEILKGLNISADIRDQSVEDDRPSGRIKASAVLMQLIACGSRRVKDWESMEIRG